MTQAASPFVWGAGGARMTPEQIEKQRQIAEAMMARGADTSPVGHWTQGAARVAQALFGAIGASRADAAEKESLERSRALLMGAIGGDSAADVPAQGAVATSANVPIPDIGKNEIAKTFLDTVSTQVSNPYGLAAVAATGQRESGWSPRNVFGQWSDPSESGAAGTSGGALSWRADRLANLRRFAQSQGDDPMRPSPATQARFFLSEDPSLIATLNAARSPDEAIGAMNNAWRFAGYNRPGGEAAARLAVARALAPQFKGRADLPAPGASPMSMPGGGEGFAIPTPGAAEGAQANIGSYGFGSTIGGPSAPSMTQAPIEPGVGMPPQQVAAPLPPPRPADLPAPGAREASIPPAPQAGVTGRSANGQEWELYQYEDDNGRVMYGTRPRGSGNASGQSLAPANAPGAAALTGQGGGIARVAQAMIGGGQAPAAPVAASVAPTVIPAPAGAPPAGGAPVAAGGRAQQLIALATDPTVPASVRQVAMALYEREAKRNEPRDMAIREVNGRLVSVDPRTGAAHDITPEGLPQKQGFRQATSEEAAKFGVPGGQFGPDGRFYPINPPTGMSVETGPDGVVRVIQGPGAGRQGAFTEAQSKDVVFATRARGALKAFEPVAGALTSPVERAVDIDPTGLIRGNVQSDKFQVARNAGDEFLQAILRKDTGAAITRDEQMLYGRTFLPYPGDNAAVLAAKAAARQRAVKALEAGMSPAQIVAQERALSPPPDAPKDDKKPPAEKPTGIDFDAVDRIVGGGK